MTAVGDCDPRFEPVREEFERNFSERGELGASVCVFVDGQPVVDLWGGIADSATGQAWQSDTINVVMSCSKGVTATCFNMLVERGRIALDAPVATYWPEFAKNGKEAITIRQAASHQAGVAHVSAPIPPGGLNDWDVMTSLIAEQAPYWEPGTRCGYHALTIGHILGEVIRRVDGRSVGTFLRQEVAEPLGLDLWIGLPEEHEGRVAPSLPFDPTTSTDPDVLNQPPPEPDSILVQLMTNNGDWITHWDSRPAHAAEVPAAGAITNARGLAGLYAPLSVGGAFNGVRLLDPKTITGLRYPQAVTDVDAVLGTRTSYTLGYSKSWPNPRGEGGGNAVIIGEDAFGTPGLGGQLGFADPAYRLAFGYTMNKHGFGTGLNARCQRLVDTVYRILGSPSDRLGYWARKD
jgi:CubicO group peptidase (beta-lactamase class C family)